MTARSDLDLMTLYVAGRPGAASSTKGWGAEAFYARFTQRLTTALSAPTAQGGLYAVDLQLRPSGRAGPVAVSLQGFCDYYAGEAETWELLALTRARVVWASSPNVFAAATAAQSPARPPRPQAALGPPPQRYAPGGRPPSRRRCAACARRPWWRATWRRCAN